MAKIEISIPTKKCNENCNINEKIRKTINGITVVSCKEHDKENEFEGDMSLCVERGCYSFSKNCGHIKINIEEEIEKKEKEEKIWNEIEKNN